MEEKKIVVIGVGGKTGTMFAFELQKAFPVLGVGKEVDKIRKGQLLVKRKDERPQAFEGKIISPSQWPVKDFFPEIIFLTTKNPVALVVKYYYQKIKKGFPVLVLSQNGIGCVQETQAALRDILGKQAKNITLVRVNLLNPVDKIKTGDESTVTYSLPIRIVFSKVSGPDELEDLTYLFKRAGFEAQAFPSSKVREMELSKLFLNLAGMASASRGLSIKQGFKKKEVFIEEMGALKEYVRVVKALGNDFLNFSHYPVKLFTNLIDFLPIKILLPLRNYLAKVIAQGREGKPKDLSEIEYYNGAVVALAQKARMSAKINQKIVNRVLK